MNKPVQKRFMPIPIEAEVIGKKLLDAAYAVHSALGPGLLESVYEACLAHKLHQQKVIGKRRWKCRSRLREFK
jgi:GxxExxY protein